MKLHALDTGNLKLDGGAMFGVVPKVIWNSLYPADENNLINLSMRCLLIEEGDRKILVDAGIGDKQSDKFFGHYYLNGEGSLKASLNSLGYSREDITDVILTHLHFDHCGGAVLLNNNTNQYEVTFPRATYWISRRQWEWATNPNNREKASFLKENILPIKDSGKLHLVENEGELLPNVSIRMFHGHTDGQMIPFIRYGNSTLVYMADLLPTHAHIPLPYIMSYDTRPLVTLDEKEIFLSEAAEKQYILFFEHDLYNECCTVVQTERGVRLSETFPLADLSNHCC